MFTANIQYQDYLTEKKLIDLFNQLKTNYPNLDFQIFTNYKISTYRGDLVIKTFYHNFLIEFDGYRHYTEGAVQARDQLKDATWELLDPNNKIVRIPYFVQLDNTTFKHYFEELMKDLDISVNIQSNYKHGFIDNKAALPCDFCSIGERVFEHNLRTLPSIITADIIESLRNKILQKKDSLQVLSINLRHFKIFEDIDFINNDDNVNCFARFQ